MSTKKIRFDYFKPCMEEDPTTQVSLMPYINYLDQIPFSSRLVPYKAGHSIRLGQIRYHSHFQPQRGGAPFNFPLWELVFDRIRPDVPGVTTSTRAELTPLQLGDDEYIAEDTTALYDPNLNYLVLQRNRGGVPASALQLFFNSMNQTDREPQIELQIITREDQLQRALQHHFHHSITLRITNTRRSDIRDNIGDNETLSNIISLANTLASDQEYPIQAELTLKIPSRGPQKTFLHHAHSALVNAANRLIPTDAVDKLIVNGSSDEESPLEEVDLINGVLQEWLNFQMDQSRFISSTRIFEELAIAYSQRRLTLPRTNQD